MLFSQLPMEGNLSKYLKEHRCPLAIPNTDNNTEIRVSLAEQLFAAAPYLPHSDINGPQNIEEDAEWFKAYLYAYNITYDTVLPPIQDKILDPFSVIETSLMAQHQSSTPLAKLEENRPGIRIEITDGANKDVATLAYDAVAKGLQWPVLDGSLLLRYQPEWKEIPYRVRLREARQIRYADTDQTYSYWMRLPDQWKRSDIKYEPGPPNMGWLSLLFIRHVHSPRSDKRSPDCRES